MWLHQLRRRLRFLDWHHRGQANGDTCAMQRWNQFVDVKLLLAEGEVPQQVPGMVLQSGKNNWRSSQGTNKTLHENKNSQKVQQKTCGWCQKKNITLKCFDNAVTFDAYQEYMDQRLQHRDQPAEIHGCRPRLRNKTTECIWNDPSLMKRVVTILQEEFFYFKYCNQCLGSSQDIFPSTKRRLTTSQYLDDWISL